MRGPDNAAAGPWQPSSQPRRDHGATVTNEDRSGVEPGCHWSAGARLAVVTAPATNPAREICQASDGDYCVT